MECHSSFATSLVCRILQTQVPQEQPDTPWLGYNVNQRSLEALYKVSHSVWKGVRDEGCPTDAEIDQMMKSWSNKEFGPELSAACKLLQQALRSLTKEIQQPASASSSVSAASLSPSVIQKFAQLVMFVSTPTSVQATIPWSIVPILMDLTNQLAQFKVSWENLSSARKQMLRSYMGSPVVHDLLKYLVQDTSSWNLSGPQGDAKTVIVFVRYLALNVQCSVPSDVCARIIERARNLTLAAHEGTNMPTDADFQAEGTFTDKMEFYQKGEYYPAHPKLRERGVFKKDSDAKAVQKDLHTCTKKFNGRKQRTGVHILTCMCVCVCVCVYMCECVCVCVCVCVVVCVCV